MQMREVLRCMGKNKKMGEIIVNRFGTSYAIVAGCQTLELTRDEAVIVSKALLKDARLK